MAVRLIALPNYPIYFFSDEAVQTTLAADLVRNHFMVGGELFPTFFKNAYQYNLGTSVYLQVIPSLLFGKTIWVTRGTSVLLSLLAAITLGLAMRNFFQPSYAWVPVLCLSITPAWFLHSRTAFETVIATSFYAGFYYFYLLYRLKDPRAIYPAILLGGLTFYSYSPARMIVLVSALFFFFSDLKYHWQQRKVILKALGLVILVALPFIRFQINHPQENQRHLEVLNSYWIQSIPLKEKFGFFFKQYIHGLDPSYWFFEINGDLPRHIMKGYGHLLRFSLPFALIGLIIALYRFRQAAYRVTLLSLLAAPSGGALVEIGITRVLIMVIPAAILSGLGLAVILEWMKRCRPFLGHGMELTAFLLLSGFNFWMVRDALVNGPFWHTDYGLGGMQWGASEVFGEIKEMTSKSPDTQISLSPSWANGTDTIAQFFFDGPFPFKMESIDGYFDRKQPLDSDRIFIMIPEEYDRIIQSPKFTRIQVDQILEYPNGLPGFYFVRLEYSPDIDTILAAESAQRRILKEEDVVINGIPAKVRYPCLDMGPINNLFDGDPRSIVRTYEANPLKLELSFDRPQTFSSLKARIGGTTTTFSYQLINDGGKVISTGEVTVEEVPDPRWLEFDLGSVQECRKVLLEIKNTFDLEPAHVHLWEIALK